MLKHNVYFEGAVQSIGFERNGLSATVGVISPAPFHFGTGQAERMTIVSGTLRARADGASDWVVYPAGSAFEIPAKSGFDVEPVGGAVAYLCEFLGT